MKITSVFILILLSFLSRAQCPIITAPSIVVFSCNSPTIVTATSNYSNNITSRWIGPGGLPLTSSGNATSIVSINHIGTYTVEMKDNQSNCIVSQTLSANAQTVSSNYGYFTLTANSYTQSCPNSILSFTMNNGQTWPINGGVIGYTMIPMSAPTPTGNFSGLVVYTINTCGDYRFIGKDIVSGCASSYNIKVSCATGTLPAVSINGTNTICQGSSSSLYASGASGFLWNTGATSNSIIISPTVTTTYTATGINGSCEATQTINIIVNPQPTVTTNNKTICAGDTIKLSATGALSYSWNNYPNLQSPIVSPSVTTVYTVTGTDANGCSNVAISTVTVNEYIGILPNSKMTSSFSLFPNPAAEYITFSHRSFNDFSMLEIYTSLGQLLFHEIIKSESTTLSIKKLPSGLYYARLVENGISETQKFIKE